MKKIRALFDSHPRLVSWALLAIAMLAVTFVAARGVPLDAAQRIAVAGAIVVLAGLCVWIIFWED